MAIYNRIICENAMRRMALCDIESFITSKPENVAEYTMYVEVNDWDVEISEKEIKRWSDLYLKVIEEDLTFIKSELDSLFNVERIKGDTIRFGYYKKIDVDRLNTILKENLYGNYRAYEEYDYEEDRGWMYWYKVVHERSDKKIGSTY